MTGTTPAMQRLLAAAALLVFIIGIPLYVATTATETFFAWTITTPLSAALPGCVLLGRRRLGVAGVPSDPVVQFAHCGAGSSAVHRAHPRVTLIHLDRCPCRNNIAAAGSGADQDRESISASARR